MEPNYSGLGLSPTTGQSRETEVSAQLNQAEKNLEALYTRLDALEARLASVLRISGPQDTTTKPEATTNTSLGTRIQNLSDAVNRATYRLSDLIGRLEI